MTVRYTPRFDFRRPPDSRGRCRWCRRRTECTWVNRRRTLCADCTEFDQLRRTRDGRKYLIALWYAAQSVDEC